MSHAERLIDRKLSEALKIKPESNRVASALSDASKFLDASLERCESALRLISVQVRDAKSSKASEGALSVKRKLEAARAALDSVSQFV